MVVRWELVAVEDWLPDDADVPPPEPLGGKEKFWVVGPDGVEYLFKYARSDDGENVRGEDWAEWLVDKLAALVGVPSAGTLPATFHGARGSLSRSVWPRRDQLVHGNELLRRADPTYDPRVARHNPRYTVDSVRAALLGCDPPPGCSAEIVTGFDAFAGYLVLDAWVAGRDRHHENWAAVRVGDRLKLMPSYDHGNALGFQEPEEKVVALAKDPSQIARWARRGRSHHFAGRPTLVEIADYGLRLATNRAAEYWLANLSAVNQNDVRDLLHEVPSSMMSEAGATFRTKLLEHNRERIIDGYHQHLVIG